MCVYFIPHKLYELNGDAVLSEQSITKLKRLTSILIIDDKPFEYLDILRTSYEFNIQQKNDLTLLSDVEAFDIVLCDIRGVGKFLNSPYEGAKLIKELKEKYPNKMIIAYTTFEYRSEFQEYLDYADKKIYKGAPDLDTWVGILTQVLRESADPVKYWERIRKALIVANVPTIEIAKYESQYVSAYEKKNFESLKKLYSKKNNIGSQIMIEIASSTLAKLFKP